MVELLISSDVAKYCEFRTLTRVLTVMEGNLQQVRLTFTTLNYIYINHGDLRDFFSLKSSY